MAKKERRLPSGLSPSSMDLYHQCPKRFEIQKIQGGYDPSGIEALMGTLVHRALELLMQKPPEERTLEVAKACATEAWPETATNKDFLLLDLTKDQIREFKHSAWWSIQGYFEIESPPDVVVVSTEEFLECKVDGVNLRGIIDRLDQEGDDIIVTDYKAGKVPDKKYRGPKMDQLNFYAAMVEQIRGVRPTEGRLLFTTHAEVISTKFTDKSVQAVKDKVVQTWADVEADFNGRGFKPNPGPLCGWCPALASCPAGMAETTMKFRAGRLKSTAPGYEIVRRAQAAS